jgi:NAD(P)-dependent dehydrogenase (short-subunit alcohol dehydrogenase family)
MRPGALEGLALLLTGGCTTLGQRSAALGASVSVLEPDAVAEETVAAAVARLGHVDVLVVDTAGAFVTAGAGMSGLRSAVDGAWTVVRAVASACWVDGGDPQARGGKLVLLAPAPDAGPHAGAVGAALENVARTLSVEWARFGVRATAIRRGPATTAAESAELVAFLASVGGDYFSGCAFALR